MRPGVEDADTTIEETKLFKSEDFPTFGWPIKPIVVMVESSLDGVSIIGMADSRSIRFLFDFEGRRVSTSLSTT